MSAMCARKLRTGDLCHMPANHRGRCSSVVFDCDACGATRRGYPASHGPDEGGPDADPHALGFCFMCERGLT